MTDISSRIVNNAKLLAALTVTLIALAVFLGAGKLGFDSDYRKFIDSSNKNLIDLEKFEDKFDLRDHIVLLISSPSGKPLLGSSDDAKLVELDRRLRQIKGIRNIDSVVTKNVVQSEGDTIYVTSLQQEVDEGANTGFIASYFDGFDQLKGALFNSNQSAVAFFMFLEYETANTFSGQSEVISEIDLAARETVSNDLRYFIVGEPVGKFFAQKILVEDLGVRLPIIMMIMFVVTYWCLRSPVLVLNVYPVVILSAGFTILSSGILGIRLNNINGLSPLIVIILSTADALHLQTHFIKARRKYQDNVKDAVIMALRGTIKPMALTTTTTAFGFLSLYTASSETINQLGLLSAIGVVFAFFCTIFLVPFLNIALSRKTIPMGRLEEPSSSKIFEDIVPNFVKRRSLSIAGFSLAICAILSIGLFSIRFNDSLTKYFSPDHEFRKNTETVQKELSPSSVSLILSAKDSIKTVQFLSEVEKLEEWLSSRSDISGVASVLLDLKEIAKSLGVQVENGLGSLESDELVAQIFLLNEISGKSPWQIGREYSAADNQIVLTLYLSDLTRIETNALYDSIHRYTANFIALDVTGPVGMKVVFDQNIMTWTTELFWGAILALFIVSLSIAIIHFSIRTFALAIFSSLGPCVIIFGAIGLLDIEITFFAAVIACVSIGIIADDTIHFLSNLKTAESNGESPDRAALTAISNIGPAMFATTASICIGLVPVLTTDFIPTLTMATIMIPLTLSAFLWDLFVIPACIIVLFGTKEQYTNAAA